MREPSDPSALQSSKAAGLFETPKLSIDRLPQLRAVFERTASGCLEDFKVLFAGLTACTLSQLQVEESWDALNARQDYVAGLFYVPGWDTHILAAASRSLVSSAIAAMFGSDGSEPEVVPGRPYSLLELNVAQVT